MAEKTVQVAAEGGVALSFGAAAAGDTFRNDGNVLALVANASGSSVTVTITAQKTSAVVSGLGTVSKGNAAGSVADGATKAFGPFPARAFNDADGLAHIGYSSTADVTVAFIRMPRQ